MARLTNEEIIKYANMKENYLLNFDNVGRGNWSSYIKQINKNVNLEYNGSFSNAITKARELQGEQVMINNIMIDDEEAEKGFDFDGFVKDFREVAKNKAKNDLLSGYVAIKDKLDKRTFWDKLLHPFKTRAENNAFKEYKAEMNKFNISDKDIYDFYVDVDPANIKAIATGNESERQRVEMDFVEASAKEEITKISDITPSLEKEEVNEL